MPTHWECQVCHTANLAEDQRCRGCGKGYRPEHWDEETWRCPQCSTENTNRQNHCEQCGYQPGFATKAAGGSFDPGGDTSRDPIDSLRRKNRGLLGEIQAELAAAMDEMAKSAESIRRPADVGGRVGGVKRTLPLAKGTGAGSAGTAIRSDTAVCGQCDGAGEISCIQCYGSGKHGADPKQPCAYCHGAGRQTCPECGGSGRA